MKMKQLLEDKRLVLISHLLFVVVGCTPMQHNKDWPQYSSNPFVIRLEIPAPTDDKGGVIVADLDGDGLMDYLVTVPQHIAAYNNQGKKLWIKKTDIRLSMDSEKCGLPGQHAPGVQAADIDRDGRVEILFLGEDGAIHTLDGSTATEEWTRRVPAVKGSEKWEHLVIANFAGKGDTDILLQATNKEGYRMGRYLSAHRAADLQSGDISPLWSVDDFLACAHTAVRVVDLDDDGRDEVIGGTVLNSLGEVMYRFPLTGHIDAIAVEDVRPDIPGLEVVVLEEGSRSQKQRDRVFLAGLNGLIWQVNYQNREPQDGAVGDFDTSRPGLEIFCRSRGTGLAAKPIPLAEFPVAGYQRPFVVDAYGQVISDYSTQHMTPDGWTPMGLQVCQTIRYEGEDKAFVAATEREQNGNVAIFDPVDGKFLRHLKNEKADRLYTVDVSGDWREEIVILNGNELHIYHSENPNSHPNHGRLWDHQHYRRSKMTWNRSSN